MSPSIFLGSGIARGGVTFVAGRGGIDGTQRLFSKPGRCGIVHRREGDPRFLLLAAIRKHIASAQLTRI